MDSRVEGSLEDDVVETESGDLIKLFLVEAFRENMFIK